MLLTVELEQIMGDSAAAARSSARRRANWRADAIFAAMAEAEADSAIRVGREASVPLAVTATDGKSLTVLLGSRYMVTMNFFSYVLILILMTKT
jgi:hypothetical protein